MQYKIPTLIMLLTLTFGIVVCISSFPPAMAEVLHPNQAAPKIAADHEHKVIAQAVEDNTLLGVSQAAQIKLLVGAVGFLFFGYMWWIQRYINKNDEKHEMHFEASNTINKTLTKLTTEHKIFMTMGGCGADSEQLKKTLEEVLEPLNLYLHRREGDPPDHVCVTSRTPKEDQ